MPVKSYYSETIRNFLIDSDERILGILTREHHHALEEPQRWAWLQQLGILRTALANQISGRIYLEFYIPRMGKRADVLLILNNIIFLLEFKIGAIAHGTGAFEQVEDYALDLKNFHEGSHTAAIVPVLISTNAKSNTLSEVQFANDCLALPAGITGSDLGPFLDNICAGHLFPHLDIDEWSSKGYRPTPTIIQAAEMLYQTHEVTDISRSDSGAKNLRETSESVSKWIDRARSENMKSICFVTGVPGSGKTLAGLDIAIKRADEHRDEHAVFLSGNGPLVTVLREALTRDKAKREKTSKKGAAREVSSFIQNIHHFRDHYVGNVEVPVEKVVVFDEAQRAWNREKAADFMQRKRGQADFDMSEPEFLISVMDRHADWCMIVCLVGGGQEINTGEVGISGWIQALQNRFSDWKVYVSPRIHLPEYTTGTNAELFLNSPHVQSDENLHLAVSMRSFRAESLSGFVGHVLDNERAAAFAAYKEIEASYPIRLTRDLRKAKEWLRKNARGTERYGLVASSGAQRLRPEGIHIKVQIDPANWFLNESTDIRSSFYMEDVASEFDVQGLEVDWAGICWDGDFYHEGDHWVHQAFKGTKWQAMNEPMRRLYLRNAYRVILTRARQGMVLFIPEGDSRDKTRPHSFYDGTFQFLRSCGIPVLE